MNEETPPNDVSGSNCNPSKIVGSDYLPTAETPDTIVAPMQTSKVHSNAINFLTATINNSIVTPKDGLPKELYADKRAIKIKQHLTFMYSALISNSPKRMHFAEEHEENLRCYLTNLGMNLDEAAKLVDDAKNILLKETLRRKANSQSL